MVRVDDAGAFYEVNEMQRIATRGVLWLAMLTALPASVAGQQLPELLLGAHAVPLLTHITPIDQGSGMTELYLTQPSLFGDVSAFAGRLRARATVSLEPLTLERGELGAGVYGEGYVDRRHPHTYLHELMLTATGDVGPVTTSLALGRGFAPFGTDDPMMRPFVKFPVNHHLGQLLERIVIIGAARIGPVGIEAATFTGVEPMSSSDLGSFDRFADSWSARVTLWPARGLELQASHASVVSPEMPRGEGLDQRKWSVSARVERELPAADVYALVEWKRTTDVLDDVDLFSFGSVLAELAVERDGWRPALRLERTERPEEERAFDRFRSPWPHAHAHFLGITRWTIVGARLERALPWRNAHVAPFLEASYSSVRETTGAGIFDPEQFYGGNRIWTFNVGARIGAGWHAPRMGRYGAAGPAPAGHHTH